MPQPLPAYSGDDPYVFVCYAHDDRGLVYPEIRRLQDGGVNIWYDEGISPGEEWDEELGRAIDRAEKLLFFVSPRSVASRHCRNEVHFAQNHDTPVLAVYLEETELPKGLELSIGLSQAIVKNKLSEDAYQERLDRVVTARGDYGRKPSNIANASGQTGAPPRSLRVSIMLAVAVIVSLAIWSSFYLTRSSAPEGSQASLTTKGVAVLPFENLSPDPEHRYFAAGLHGEVINRLSKVPDLSVIARGSVLAYSQSDKTLGDIARELDVSALVEGTVRYAGNRVRVTAQVVSVASMETVWSDTLEYEFKDVFSIESDVAGNVAAALSDTAAQADQALVSAPRTDNPDAYAAYIRGASLAYMTLPRGPAFEALGEAIEKDPGFASAYALRAFLKSLTYYPFPDQSYDPQDQERDRRQAESDARKAIELDPMQARAWLALGVVAWDEDRREESADLIAKAYELAPRDIYALDYMQGLAVNNNDYDAFIRFSDTVLAIDPANPHHHFIRAWRSWWLQAFEESSRSAQRLIELYPDLGLGYSILARSEAMLGRTAQASEVLSHRLSIGDLNSLASISDAGLIYGLTGQPDRAHEMVRAIEELAQQQWVPADSFARVYLGLADQERAIHWLELSAQGGERGSMAELLTLHPEHPIFDSVRDSPAFERLARGVTRKI